MAEPLIDPGADPAELMQILLDMFSDQPGALLYRGPDGWEALLPGNAGDVLTLNDNLLPSWQPPA